jgi:hypothetical protein
MFFISFTVFSSVFVVAEGFSAVAEFTFFFAVAILITYVSDQDRFAIRDALSCAMRTVSLWGFAITLEAHTGA